MYYLCGYAQSTIARHGIRRVTLLEDHNREKTDAGMWQKDFPKQIGGTWSITSEPSRSIEHDTRAIGSPLMLRSHWLLLSVDHNRPHRDITALVPECSAAAVQGAALE